MARGARKTGLLPTRDALCMTLCVTLNMKASGFLAAVALAATVSGASADVVMVQNVEQTGKPYLSTQVTLKVKGTKIRADLGPETTIIMDTASGATVTLRHPQKTALEIDGKATRQLMDRAEHLRSATEIGKPQLQAAGKGETIAGRETRRFTAQTASLKVTWWLASKSGDRDPLAVVFETLQKAPMVRLAGGLAGFPGADELPGLPVKTEMVTPDGRTITTTIVSVQEEPLDAIDFAAPTGYRRLTGPAFGPDPFSAP